MAKDITIRLYDDIGGDGITAAKFRTTVDYLVSKGYDRITMRMITLGGSVRETNGIVDCIKEHQRKGVEFIAINDCYVISAGMMILVNADYAYGTENSLSLIHRAWAVVVGNSEETRKASESLEEATEPSIQAFMNKTGRTREEILALMDEERELTIHEAINFGLYDGVYYGQVGTEDEEQAGIYLKKLEKVATKTDDQKKLIESLAKITIGGA